MSRQMVPALLVIIVLSACTSGAASRKAATVVERCYPFPPETTPKPNFPGCSNYYTVPVNRHQDGSISVDNFEVDEGVCIAWDYASGRVTLVDFMSSAEPQLPANKFRSSHNVKDIACSNNEHPCGWLNTHDVLHGGILSYQVTVMEGTQQKMTDPEIVVDCTSLPCIRHHCHGNH